MKFATISLARPQSEDAINAQNYEAALKELHQEITGKPMEGDEHDHEPHDEPHVERYRGYDRHHPGPWRGVRRRPGGREQSLWWRFHHKS